MSSSKPDAVNLRRMGPDAADKLSAGALCLDFAATLQRCDGRTTDALDHPERLGEWLAGSGLPIPAGGLTGEDLDAAHRLRSSIDGVARALIAGADVSATHVRAINTFAQHHTPVFLLRPNARQRIAVEQVDIAGSLSVVARDAMYVFAVSDPSRLRECARETCQTLFYDRSPTGRRRWCAMKGCGEIVASASYRQRRAAKAES